MLLSNLNKIIKIKKVFNFDKDNKFTSITSNSKLSNFKTIFIYDKNTKVKKDYVKEAISKKIPAIITNKHLEYISIPQFIVNDINQETEILLKKIYKNIPHKIIAITGTNGKTSVVWYISKILTKLKYNNTTVGTLGCYKNGKKVEDVNLTTPGYEELYKYGNSIKEKNNIYIFEASSHALQQNRIRNYPVNIAAITNITNDHLDFHKNLSEYRKAKIKLFTNHLDNKGFAIINSRIKNTASLKNKLINRGIVVKYFGNKNVVCTKKKNFNNLKINKNNYKIKKLKLNTSIELENLECAILCCLVLKINEKKIINSLSFLSKPPGRFQIVNYNKKKSKIIIDYAHTPDALMRTLKSFSSKTLKPKLIFGCGGDRDKNKRKTMGKIANRYSSKVYVTDDNPRNENPNVIRKNIIKYCPSAIEIANRKTAIKTAIKELNKYEILIIAGKGHEKFQLIKNKKYKFDDFKIVKSLITS